MCVLVGAVAGIIPSAIVNAHAGTRVSSKKTNCGAISVAYAPRPVLGRPAPITVESGSPKDPIGCLVEAVAHCRPATLRFDNPERFGSSTSDTLEVIRTSGSCGVAYSEGGDSVWSSANSRMQCTSVQRHSGELVLAGCTSSVQLPTSTNYIMEG